MAWVVRREGSDGGPWFQVRFRDVDGIKRSAGTFASRREAVKAGRRVDGKVEDSSWIDPAAGRVTFRDYVEQLSKLRPGRRFPPCRWSSSRRRCAAPRRQ